MSEAKKLRPKIAVVIPCYRVRSQIVDVVAGVPNWVDLIFAIDDCCPEQSGKFLQQTANDPRLHVVFHESNQGVGGATMSGFREALNQNAEIVVKMDGDGQMDVNYLARLVQPILQGQADFTKGNRFFDLIALRQMPAIRRIGNLGLTLLTKASSGFWHISDPTNGYIAVHGSALRLLNFDRISRRYFFETSFLIQLNIIRAVAIDIPIPARYGNETSSLNIWRAFFGFPPRLAAGLLRRVFWRYFIFDISAVSLLLIVGSLAVAGGVSFGTYRWWLSETHGQAQTAGTVAIALLPTLLGMQMLLQCLLLDVMDRTTVPIQRLINDAAPASNVE